eukprot:10528159-Ditylum_brightwellii.AAC.1
MSLWPEEVDIAGKEVHQGNSDNEIMTNGDDVLGNDRLNEGPAPLQTVQHPEVIFEVILHNAVEGRSSKKAAEEALQILDEKAKSLARQVRTANENVANERSTNVGQLSQGRETLLQFLSLIYYQQ